jgi:hypothetical protein
MTPQLIETDERSRVVLPGHADERFIMQENDDGSVLLIPARVMSEAQYEYDTTPELQELLHKAMTSPMVRRPRRKRPAP